MCDAVSRSSSAISSVSSASGSVADRPVPPPRLTQNFKRSASAPHQQESQRDKNYNTTATTASSSSTAHRFTRSASSGPRGAGDLSSSPSSSEPATRVVTSTTADRTVTTLVLLHNRRNYIKNQLPHEYGVKYALLPEGPQPNKASLLRQLVKREELQAAQTHEDRANSSVSSALTSNIVGGQPQKRGGRGEESGAAVMEAMERAKARHASDSIDFDGNHSSAKPKKTIKKKLPRSGRNVDGEERQDNFESAATSAAVIDFGEQQQQQQSPSKSVAGLQALLAQERRRHHALLERQRQMLLRQQQKIHLAQEIHKIRMHNASIEDQLRRDEFQDPAATLSHAVAGMSGNSSGGGEHQQQQTINEMITAKRVVVPVDVGAAAAAAAASGAAQNVEHQAVHEAPLPNQRAEHSASSSSSLLPDFPVQPPLPLAFQAYAEVPDDPMCSPGSVLPRREDGGVELISTRPGGINKKTTKPGQQHFYLAPSPSVVVECTPQHDVHLVDPANLAPTAAAAAAVGEDAPLSRSVPAAPGADDASEGGNSLAGAASAGVGVGSSGSKKHALPYRRATGASQHKPPGSSMPASSPVVTPHHLRGGIFFGGNSSSKKSGSGSAADTPTSASVALQQLELQRQSQQHQRPSATSVVTRKLDVDAPLQQKQQTAAAAEESTGPAPVQQQQQQQQQQQPESPVRRRILAVETKEWMGRRSLETEEAHAARALGDGKNLSLLGTFPSSGLTAASGGATAASADASVSPSVSCSFSSQVPPLLMYDLVLGVAERAAWFEQVQQKQKSAASSTSTSSHDIAPLHSFLSGDAAAVLMPKPQIHKKNTAYHSSLWREISAKEESAIVAARERFEQKHKSSSSGSGLSTQQPFDPRHPHAHTQHQKMDASFAPFFFLPPKSVLGPLLQSSCALDVARRMCAAAPTCSTVTAGGGGENPSDDGQASISATRGDAASAAGISTTAANVVTTSFKRPSRAAAGEAAVDAGMQLPMVGRAQMQSSSAELQAADDILWHLADLILGRASRKIASAEVVRALYR